VTRLTRLTRKHLRDVDHRADGTRAAQWVVMHPFLMPALLASFLGNPSFSAPSAVEVSSLQRPLARSTEVAISPSYLTLPTTSTVSVSLPTEKLRPRWTGKVGDYALTVTPRKESGGFKIDVEVAF
jgi:hypothetical protein